MNALTLVNRAIGMAVRVSCDFAPADVGDLSAYAHSVGKRLQGTYGAELRRLADDDPELNAEDLYRAVIAPTEFPWLVHENPHAAELRAAGARDRARKAHYQEPPDFPSGRMADDPEWAAGLAAAKAAVGEYEPQPYVPEHVPDAEFAAQIDKLRAAAMAGKAEFAQRRKERLDRNG